MLQGQSRIWQIIVKQDNEEDYNGDELKRQLSIPQRHSLQG